MVATSPSPSKSDKIHVLWTEELPIGKLLISRERRIEKGGKEKDLPAHHKLEEFLSQAPGGLAGF
jgi:hypothetical protein